MRKLAYLEGLRGIAALIVVFHHLVLMFYPALNYGEETNSLSKFVATTPLNIFYNGAFAVSLFFVLSGYVLSYKYILTNDSKIPIGYAIKRYFRLMPLIGVSVIFAFVIVRLNVLNPSALNAYTGSGDWLLELFNADQSFLSLIKNIFYGVLFTGDNQYNPVVWSMKIEFISSMLLFAFLLVGHKLKQKWILFTIAFGVSFYFMNYYDIAFLFGYGLCYLHQNNKIKIGSLLLKSILLLFAVMFSSYPASWEYWDTSIYCFMHFKAIDLYSFYHVLGAALFLLLILQHEPSKNFLSLKPVLFLGKISFALYLFHLVLLLAVTAPLFRLFIPHLGYHISFLASVIISLPVIGLVSYFTTKLIDQPALKFSNALEKWFLVRLFKKDAAS